MFTGIYNNKNIFVTGHTGFKGSWLCAWLLSLGSRVTGFSLGLPTNPSNFAVLGLSDKVESIEGDVRNRDKLAATVKTAAPDVIFHLAAQPLVRHSYEKPADTFETNVLGTLNILEAARQCPSVKAIIIITSDKCYKNNEWAWGYRETDPLGGSDPYSASKGCAELLAQSYFESFFKNVIPCATVRAGNVIGGGDWAGDRIVPDCARAWAEGKAVEIRNPEATRPWQHVLEPLSGYLWLGAGLLDREIMGQKFNPFGEAYNFGPSADVVQSVGEVVAGLSQYWPGFQKKITQDQDAAKKECGLLKLACDKALLNLHWKAVLDFGETIRKTAEWYSAFYGHKHAMLDFTLDQIADYAKTAAKRGLAWAQR